MAVIATKKWILLCGIYIAVATPLCHAQDSGKLFDVTIPATEASPALAPMTTSNAVPGSTEIQPDKKVPDQLWYWRLLQGLALGIARNNTEKQNDGRPWPVTDSR